MSTVDNGVQLVTHFLKKSTDQILTGNTDEIQSTAEIQSR